MTLHYRKLLIGSILFPVVVMGCLAISLPSLMPARGSSTFGQLRANAKSLPMQAVMIETVNQDPSLVQPIGELQEMIADQQDTLVDLRDVVLAETESAGGPGWVALVSALVSAIVGMIGILSSVLLSWRQDMRQVRSEARTEVGNSLTRAA